MRLTMWAYVAWAPGLRAVTMMTVLFRVRLARAPLTLPVACRLNRVAGLLMRRRLGPSVTVWVSTSCRVLFLDSLWNLCVVIPARRNASTTVRVLLLVRTWLTFRLRSGRMMRLTVACSGTLRGPRKI